MTRIEFTKAVGQLIHQADLFDFNIILDWCKRDAETQYRMWKKGLSKCDGAKVLSQHQKGLAIDIYIIEDGKISDDQEKYKLLHDCWLIYGGKPMIDWDGGHFEG